MRFGSSELQSVATAGGLEGPPVQVPRALLAPQVGPSLVVGASLGTRHEGVDVPPDDAERRRLLPCIPQRAEHEIPRAIAEVVGRATLVRPGTPLRAVALTFAAVVAEVDLLERDGPPSARVRLELVDAVPAHPLLERQQALEHLPPVRARGAPHGAAGDEALLPDAL